MKKFLVSIFLLTFLVNTLYSTTYTVINTNDNGPGSLRSMLMLANSNSGKDTICFNIPGTGLKTISFTANLFSITDPLYINGLSQPGSSPGNLKIALDGSGISSVPAYIVPMTIKSSNCKIEGLIFQYFCVYDFSGNMMSGEGIVIRNAENTSLYDVEITNNVFKENGLGIGVRSYGTNTSWSFDSIYIHHNAFYNQVNYGIMCSSIGRFTSLHNESVIINDNNFQGDTMGAIFVYSPGHASLHSNISGFQISKNTITGNSQQLSYGIRVKLGSNSSFQNNLLDSNIITSYKYALSLQTGDFHGIQSFFVNNFVTNNQISQCHSGIRFDASANIAPLSLESSFLIHNNDIVGGGSSGSAISFNLHGTGVKSALVESIDITYNKLDGFDNGIFAYTGGTGGFHSKLNDILIDSNQFTNNGNGIWIVCSGTGGAISQVGNVTILNNDIHNNGTGIEMKATNFVEIETTLENILIQNNNITLNMSDGISAIIEKVPLYSTTPRYSNIRFTENSIWDNVGKGASLNFTQGLLNLPVPKIDSAIINPQGINMWSSVNGDSIMMYIIDYYGSTDTYVNANFEGEVFLGSDTIQTNNSGIGVSFFNTSDTTLRSITATATALSDTNTSEFSDAANVDIILSVEDPIAPQLLVVFPNPTSEQLKIEISNLLTGETVNVFIYSTSGQVVLKKILSNKNGTLTIDINSLPQGVYCGTVTNSDGQRSSFRFIKN